MQEIFLNPMFKNNCVVESISHNFGVNPSVAVFKEPNLTGNKSFSLGDEVSFFNFRGTIQEVGNENSENGERWFIYVCYDYRFKYNNEKIIYKVYNTIDDKLPSGTIMNENGDVISYKNEPYTLSEIINDIEAAASLSIIYKGLYDLNIESPELKFEFIGVCDAIEIIVKLIPNGFWYLNSAGDIVIDDETNIANFENILFENSRETLDKYITGYKILGSHELKEVKEEECTYLSGDYFNRHEVYNTNTDIDITTNEVEYSKYVLRANNYPQLTADTKTPLSQRGQWVGNLLSNPSASCYVEAYITWLKKPFNLIQVNCINKDYNPFEDESETNPKTVSIIRAGGENGNYITAYPILDENGNITGYSFDKFHFDTSDYLESGWVKIDASIDIETGLINIDYEKLKTIDSLVHIEGTGDNIRQFQVITEDTPLEAEYTATDSRIEISYSFNPRVRATYVYKGDRIVGEAGTGFKKGHIDERYRKFVGYNTERIDGFPVYENDTVDDTNKLITMANQALQKNIKRNGTLKLLLSTDITPENSGAVAGINHRLLDGFTEIYLSDETMESQFNLIPEKVKYMIKKNNENIQEINQQAIRNMRDTKLGNAVKKLEVENRKTIMGEVKQHNHAGKSKTIGVHR